MSKSISCFSIDKISLEIDNESINRANAVLIKFINE